MVESVSAMCPGLVPAKQTEIITSTPPCLWFVLKCCGGFHIHEALWSDISTPMYPQDIVAAVPGIVQISQVSHTAMYFVES